MRLFAVGLGIAGWLCSGVQSLSPVMAADPCTLTAPAPSALIPSSFTSFGSMPLTVQSKSNSYFEVTCPGSGRQNGNLSLSILSSTANSTPQFQVASADGIFPNTVYSGNSITIRFTATASNANGSGGTRTGRVYYQVSVAAPTGKVLQSATDYAVKIRAALLP